MTDYEYWTLLYDFGIVFCTKLAGRMSMSEVVDNGHRFTNFRSYYDYKVFLKKQIMTLKAIQSKKKKSNVGKSTYN